MEFRGYVDKGGITPTEPIGLPDGTPVTISASKGGATKRSSARPAKAKPISGWQSISLRELVTAQRTRPLKNLGQLAGDWPRGDSIDEFLKSVRKGRR